MVSHPKIEAMWMPKGQQQQQRRQQENDLTNHSPDQMNDKTHNTTNNQQPSNATTTNDEDNNYQNTTSTTVHNDKNQNRLHIPRLRNLLSALCFEHHDVSSSVSEPASLPSQQQQQRNTTVEDAPVHNTVQQTPPSKQNRASPSSSKILRGSIIETELNRKSDVSDVFYDALEYGNSPYNNDDFLPDSESPRESVVLAGVIVTTGTASALRSPERHHSNIETVLRGSSNNDDDDDDDDHNYNNDPMNKSVEYTEHEYANRLTSIHIDGEGSALTQQSNVLRSDDDKFDHSTMTYPPASPPAPDELPLRFLRAGKNDPIEGGRRYQATLQMRREQNIDAILREPSDKFNIIKQHYPHYCHFRGKNNEPCFYEQPPKTNLLELRKHGITLDKLLRHYTMVTEYQWQYIERDDLARSIYIIDLDGIRMTDFVGEAVDFVKKASAFSAQHYPERAGYVFVINVPGWFKLIWNVIKPIIDEDTLKKIYILRGKDEIRTAMQERIHLEHIPPEYGGTSVPLGQSPQEQTFAEWMQHNNTLADEGRNVCHNCKHCKFCTWVPARSY